MEPLPSRLMSAIAGIEIAGVPWPIVVAVVGIVAFVAIPLFFRRVVEPNEVHIVQSRRKTKSYGKEQPAGNAYYEWPSWIPYFGVQVVVLPLSVFDIELPDYDAYDIGKVPFRVDVVAFFRIMDSNLAASRIFDFPELKTQLKAILQGATRTILAKSEIETIMEERSQYGDLFTAEVDKHIKAWGVETVKSIELMDIRDPADRSSKTISDIMDKKKSLIERQSRIEVAENVRAAETAEIEAKREVQVSQEQARQAVGERRAGADRQIGIAQEQANQEIKEQQRLTTEKEMAVRQVEVVRNQEIARDAAVVKADEDKRTTIIRSEAAREQDIITAEGEKRQQILKAEGFKDAEVLRSQGILAVGTKEADVIQRREVAQVQGQITLAEVIGENEGYQAYLVRVRDIERAEAVGVEQAKALGAADVRVITNAGTPNAGLDKVMDLFSAKGGTEVASAVEAFGQTPVGEALLEKFGIDREPDIRSNRPKNGA